MSGAIPPPDYPAILSAAAHDLRSPLSTVYGFARTIERVGALEPQQAGFLQHIMDAARDLDGMLDHVSLLGRIGDGRFAPVAQPVAARELADRAAAAGELERGDDVGPAGTVSAAADEAVDALVLLARASQRLDPARRVLAVAAASTGVLLLPISPDVRPFLDGAPGARDLSLVTALQTMRALGATLEVDGQGTATIAFPPA